MQILVIGSGGREHALAWQVAKDEKVSMVYVAPGNAGTAMEPGIENVDISADDYDNLLVFAKENSIDLTIVGKPCFAESIHQTINQRSFRTNNS